MCGAMTTNDLEVFKNKAVSAYTDRVMSDDAVTRESLILAVQDWYMALMEERAISVDKG